MGNVIQELLIRIRYVVDNGGLEKSNNAVRSLRRTIAGIGVGAGLYKVGQTAVRTAAQLESAQAQFETMLGSKAAADKMMNEMWEYAAMSTFEMTDVTKASTTMLNYGLTQEQTTEAMKRLGDVAGDSGPKFQRLALAYAQSFGKMRLTGEELRQFINAGANPLKEIANKHFGGDYAAAEDAMRKRKISFAMVEEAMKSLTSEGGKFYQNQLRQSQTLTGVYTTMKDKLKGSLAKMVMAFSVPLKAMMRWIGSINFQTVIDGVQWLAYAVQYLAKQIWETGLQEGWTRFVKSLQDAGVIMKNAGGPTYTFGVALRALGLFLGKLLGNAFQFYAFMIENFAPMWPAISGAIRFVTYTLYSLAWAFGVVRDILQDLYESWITPVIAGLAIMAGWWAAISTGIGLMSGTALMATPAMAGLLAALMKLGGFMPALATKLALLTAPILLAAAAVFSIGYAIYKIKQAVDEKEAREIKANEDAGRGQIEDELNKRSKELDAARASGDKKRIDTAYKRWKAMKDSYFKNYVDSKPEEEFGDTTFEAFIQRQTANSDMSVKKQVDSSGKTTNINQKVDFKVNVEGDKNAKSGLTAADVALLAERASRATFSIELERVLTGVV